MTSDTPCEDMATPVSLTTAAVCIGRNAATVTDVGKRVFSQIMHFTSTGGFSTISLIRESNF